MIILGIDIGGTGMKAAPVDTHTGLLTARRHRVVTPQPSTPGAMAHVVTRLTEHFDWHGPIGIAFPARVKHGVAYTASNIDETWRGTNGEALFQEATGCPVRFINDADAAGVAEMAFGAGRGHEGVALMLTFGTGIGSGLFIDGVLVPNTELGHLELQGKNAERYASARTRKRKKLGWKSWAKRVQKYLNHVEFLIAPDLIIIGGGVSRPHKLDRYFHRLKTTAELVPAQLQNEAGIIGAAFAAQTLVSEPDAPLTGKQGVNTHMVEDEG